MENKKEKIKLHFKDQIFLYLSIIIIFYFFYGFYTDENSAGAGGYNGDLKLIWYNLELLKQGIISNLDNTNYNDSRPPLSYILHIFFNPFINVIFINFSLYIWISSTSTWPIVSSSLNSHHLLPILSTRRNTASFQSLSVDIIIWTSYSSTEIIFFLF